MKEHVWVRKSAVYKALGKKQGEQTDSSFDWARAILLSVGVNNSPIISLELDDDDLPDDIQGQHVKLPQNSLILPTNQWVDSPQQEPPSDLITLTHLHEAAVVYCLEKRFQQNQIYTATGPILIALNPFQDLPDLYSEATMSKYWAAGEGIHFMENLPPHVYESAHDAFKRMMESLMQQKEMELHYQNDESLPNVVCNQVILVSGESGAGKTVTTKHLMRYLATLSQRKAEHLKKRRAPSPGRSETNLPERTKLVRRISARSVSWKAGALIEEKILESNPILEAFGNARTIRNDNSSRFGKFIELQFKHTGSLIGASIETYLLEKVRLIHQASDERNFHVFYEMLAAATPQERTQLFLENYTARDFKMTSQSGTYTRRDGVNDAQLFDKLVLAMRTLGFDPDIQMDIFTVVTAVLHASNLDFVAVTDDSSTVDEKNAHVQPFLQLLGLDKDNFKQAICGIDIEVGNKLYTRDVDKKLAEKHLEALVKSTYGAMFSYIVQSINKKINYREQTKKMHGSTTAAFIGVLDIFGFESFPVNSFEQLCINYCNEALQQQFNLFVFKTEQEEYRREGIQWEFIDFPDNQDVIDLIDQKRTGILSILTDQCRAPRGTDGSFCDAMYKTCGSMPRFEATNLQRGHKQFTIVHYAGPVTYETDGFVEKNKDEIPRGASKLLKSSSKDFVKLLGMMMDNSAGASGGTSDSDSPRASAKKKRPTIASQFKMQLDELRTRVDSTMPHYIRCLKPNQSLMPNEFDKGMIASQLINAGVLEAIRVSRVSYSQRFGHKVFVDRYRVIDVNNSDTIESLVDSITAMVKSDDGEREKVGIQVGATKIFLRQHEYDCIERLRSQKLNTCSILLQSVARGYIARERYSRVNARLIAFQALVRGFSVRQAMEKQHGSATTIQSLHRGNVARSELAARKEARKKQKLIEEKQPASASGMKRQDIAEKAIQQTFVSDFPNVASLDPASLRSEVKRLTEELARSNARVSTIEAENKTLKLKLKQKKKAETNYSKHLSKHYKDFPDLYDLCEEMGALTHQSKQSKRDLDKLVKSLEILRDD